VVRDEDGLQIDFMASIHGVRSFASLRSRARVVAFDNARLLVADLADVIRSKKAAGRPRDMAALPILEKTLDEETRNKKNEAGGSEERE